MRQEGYSNASTHAPARGPGDSSYWWALSFYSLGSGQVKKGPRYRSNPTEIRTSVITAVHAIPKGTLLRQDDLKSGENRVEELDREASCPARRKTSWARSVARFRRRRAPYRQRFIKPSDRNFLAAVLKPGSRAISIFVDAAQSVAGLALQGDYVDVILIQSFEDKITVYPRRTTAGETVLHGVRVIALDQT